jgi:predicted RNase H-like HicB family nuclease
MKREVKVILARPYTRELVKNEDGTWFARVVEFVGCMTEGNTSEEAMNHLDEAMEAWVESHLDDGGVIPPPLSSDQYSGKFLMRPQGRSGRREPQSVCPGCTRPICRLLLARRQPARFIAHRLASGFGGFFPI